VEDEKWVKEDLKSEKAEDHAFIMMMFIDVNVNKCEDYVKLVDLVENLQI